MSESLLEKVKSLLTEEMWTSTQLASYSVSQFEKLESFLSEAYEQKQTVEIKNLCDERLKESKVSVLALYLSGMIAWEDQQLEDSDLTTLIGLFTENAKWSIVEYIAKKMLVSGENKVALKALVQTYEKQSQEVEYYKALERLAKLDYEDGDLTLKLAKYYEDKGDKEETFSYYTKSIYRYINRKYFTGVQEVWNKFLTICVDEDFFTTLVLKVEKVLGQEKAVELEKSLYQIYKKNGKWADAIALLKKILAFNNKDVASRKELVACYKEEYASNSRLKECVAISSIEQNWRNVQEAYESFEKHICLDKGRFVFHKTWGVGRVKSVNEQNVVLDFAKKRGHEMGLEMAVSSLLTLSEDHIWVLRATTKKEELAKKIKKDIPWSLKMLAMSFGGECDMKKAKQEFCPSDAAAKGLSLLSTSEWSTWSSEARNVIKNDSSFGNNSSKDEVFILRSTPVSVEEKIANRFKIEEDFFKKLDLVDEFLEKAGNDNNYFNDMFNYFFNYLKTSEVNEKVVTSFLFVQKMIKNKVINVTLPYSFEDLYTDISDVDTLFMKINRENDEFSTEFLHQVRRYVSDWAIIFVRFFPQSPSDFMLEELLKENKTKEILEAMASINDRYRANDRAFFWLIKFLITSEETFGLKKEKLLINLLHLVELSDRNIGDKKDLADNKRIMKRAQTLLFKDGFFTIFVEEADESDVARANILLSKMSDFYKDAEPIILAKYPNLKIKNLKSKSKEKEFPVLKSTNKNGILVLESSYKDKTAELKNIIEVEIPKNSAEIGEAIKKGDLKENAEYIFGKERQEQLQKEVGRLQKEIDQARIFEMEKLDTTQVGFATVVTLKKGTKKEVYTFLGPWESNPDDNVLSYLAPFSSNLMGAKIGDKLEFTINEVDHSYVVEKIEPYKV